MIDITVFGDYFRSHNHHYWDGSKGVIKTLLKITFAIAVIYTLGKLFSKIYRSLLPPSLPPPPSITGKLPPRSRASSLSSQAPAAPPVIKTPLQTQLYTLIPKNLSPCPIMRDRIENSVNFANYFYKEILRGDRIQDGIIQGNSFSFNYEHSLKIPLKKVPEKITEALSLPELQAKQTCFDPYSCIFELDQELSGEIHYTESAIEFHFFPESAFLLEGHTLIGHLKSLTLPYDASQLVELELDYKMAGMWPDKDIVKLIFTAQEWIAIFDYNLFPHHYI
ncbi:hypothetical protein [Rhabdochlamydiaceae symbiont of Dictyostelium giganteum]|uniref:hypothetical protein n=1 Tax=Rhabdochlamydiaceae symbiont of Dictyostelium giganteum TaxID=3342349 RepID=UPI00384BB736